MDSEQQPLLGHASDVRCKRLRPLTQEEILTAHQDITWRRTRFCLIFMFWAAMAMFLSMIALIVITSSCTDDRILQQTPVIPPVHMSFAPLLYSLSGPVLPVDDERVYTL